MPSGCRSFSEFLNEYNFPQEPDHNFELAGVPADYASGHPKEWGRETQSFDFGEKLKSEAERASSSFCSALSPDKKLLAISSGVERIVIYDVESKELRQVLDGTGAVAFRPIARNGRDAEDGSEHAEEVQGKPAYTLVSSIKDATSPGYVEASKLTLWELDHNGRLLDEEEPIDPSTLATKAIDAILPDLQAKHEWTKDFVAASNLHADFAKALGQVAAEHRRRHNTVIENARLGNFGSISFSNDGRWLLYHQENQNTQSCMRSSERLPHVIIYDIDAGKETYRLRGHTDAIMWSGISPDDQHIASVSWDGTMRMYSATTGELEWVTEGSGGQSWAGAFSPDSEYIVWSSNCGQVIQVHDVAEGRAISRFSEKLPDWCRCFAWNSDCQQIALCAGRKAYVWRPFEGLKGKITQYFALDDKGWHFAAVEKVSWMNNGKLLCLQINDGTQLVYDTQTNAKETFKRPDGVHPAWVVDGFYGFFATEGDQDFYLSVDGDGKVRYWRTSVAAFPSWWDKEEEKGECVKKTPYPETGKYVKVTKQPKKEEKRG